MGLKLSSRVWEHLDFVVGGLLLGIGLGVASLSGATKGIGLTERIALILVCTALLLAVLWLLLPRVFIDDRGVSVRVISGLKLVRWRDLESLEVVESSTGSRRSFYLRVSSIDGRAAVAKGICPTVSPVPGRKAGDDAVQDIMDYLSAVILEVESIAKRAGN